MENHARGRPVDLRTASRVLGSSTQELIIMPTEKCNFRCTYCYEDFKVGKMAPETVTAVKMLLEARSKDVDTLHISWFGGEPLLAKDIMIEVSSYAKQLCESQGKAFSSSATTNGFLLDESLLQKLLRSGVTQYQISLDGPRVVHDKTRILHGGGGSFDKILNNLVGIVSLLEHPDTGPCNILLRLHYDNISAYGLDAFVGELKSVLRESPSFSVFFHEISRLGSDNDSKIDVPTATAHAHVRKLQQRIADGGWPVSRAALEPEESYICYAAKANSLLIRADGRIGKCTVALNNPLNDIGRLLEDGRITIDNDKLRVWIRGLFSGDSSELACPLVDLDSFSGLTQPITLVPRATMRTAPAV